MTEQTFRTIGSLLGLAIGIALMLLVGVRGSVPSALFGAAGCVTGAGAAEKIYASSKNRNR